MTAIAPICSSCMQGDHEHCQMPDKSSFPDSDIPPCQCTEGVCAKRWKDCENQPLGKQEAFLLAATKAVYGEPPMIEQKPYPEMVESLAQDLLYIYNQLGPEHFVTRLTSTVRVLVEPHVEFRAGTFSHECFKRDVLNLFAQKAQYQAPFPAC